MAVLVDVQHSPRSSLRGWWERNIFRTWLLRRRLLMRISAVKPRHDSSRECPFVILGLRSTPFGRLDSCSAVDVHRAPCDGVASRLSRPYPTHPSRRRSARTLIAKNKFTNNVLASLSREDMRVPHREKHIRRPKREILTMMSTFFTQSSVQGFPDSC
jgi:hypothetical protein